jgi:hypothetical protein
MAGSRLNYEQPYPRDHLVSSRLPSLRCRLQNGCAPTARATDRHKEALYRRRYRPVEALWCTGSRGSARRCRALLRTCHGGGAAASDKKSAVEKTDKPDSVMPGICSQAEVIISLGFELPRTSSDLPEDLGRASRLPTLRRKPTDVFLFGLASGNAYRAGDVTTTAVGSYPTVSPLPEPRWPN